jgi:twitching motility protein PilT
MQTFDQSLMWLLRSNLITYEEALRQATNPDDFALRVSGISSTSDSKWDNFEKAPDAAGAPRPPASPAAAPRAQAAAAVSVGRVQPAAAAKPPEDDFQIERF